MFDLKHLFLAASVLLCTEVGGFEIQKARIAPFQTQRAPGETTHLTRTGFYPVAAMEPTTNENFDSRFACIRLSVSSEPGGMFEGKEIRRIAFDADKPVSGDVLVDVTYHDLMFEENSGKSSSVTLDVLQGSSLGNTQEIYYATLYPAGATSLSVRYWLRDASGKVEVLSHKIGGVSLQEGAMTRVEDRLPAKLLPGWTLTEHRPDIEAYKKAVSEIIRAAGLPTMQVTRISNIDTVMFTVVNEAFYKSHPERRKEILRPFDMQSIYQACSISKTPCCYIYMKMASDGEVDLDKPLTYYYPGLVNRFKPAYRERVKLITGRMAESHLSGGGPGYSNMPLDFYPGYHYDYRNSNTCMLQWTIEHIKGEPLDSVAKHYIFDKRDMPTTSYTWIPAYDSLAVFNNAGKRRHNGWEHNKWGTPEPEFWWAHEAYNNNASYHMRTNSNEFSRFLQWYITGAELSEDIYNQMMSKTVRTSNPSPTVWRTIGSWVLEDNPEWGRFIMHTGSNGAFKGLAMIFPERNTTLSCWANGRHHHTVWRSVTNVLLDPVEPFCVFPLGLTPIPKYDRSDNKQSIK